MAKKTEKNKPAPEAFSEDQKLLAKVDAMMATQNQDMTPGYEPKVDLAQVEPEAVKEEVKEAPKDVAADTKTGPAAEALPPLDIFADVPGAPPLETKTTAKTASAKKPAKKVKITQYEEEPEVIATSVKDTSAEEPESQAVLDPQQPPNYDDSVLAKAIEDIVSKESDAALNAVDEQTEQSEELDMGRHYSKRTHHLFWTFVTLVCLIAIAMAVFIIDPSIHNPLRNLHWSSIRKHL